MTSLTDTDSKWLWLHCRTPASTIESTVVTWSLSLTHLRGTYTLLLLQSFCSKIPSSWRQSSYNSMNIDMCVTSDYPYMAADAARVVSITPSLPLIPRLLQSWNLKGPSRNAIRRLLPIPYLQGKTCGEWIVRHDFHVTYTSQNVQWLRI